MVSSFIVKHRLWGAWASVFVAHGHGCPARGIQDLPGPVEPVSPVLAGGLSTTGPPRSSASKFLRETGVDCFLYCFCLVLVSE